MNNFSIKRYIMEPLKSNMYIVIYGTKAIIVDPCINEEAIQLLQEMNIDEVYIILTHEHFDHVSGANVFKQKFNTKVLAQFNTAKRVSEPKNRIIAGYVSTFIGKDAKMLEVVKTQCRTPILIDVDISFENDLRINWCGYTVNLISTPGHTSGSCCIIFDNDFIFTGDSLIPGETVITRFVSGSLEAYRERTLPFFKSLNPEMTVLPGHGEQATLGELL